MQSLILQQFVIIHLSYTFITDDTFQAIFRPTTKHCNFKIAQMGTNNFTHI